MFIAEGDKLAERLIASRYPVVSVLAEAAQADRFEPLLAPQTPIYIAERKLLEATIGFNFHRGVLACGRRLPGPTIEELLADRLPTDGWRGRTIILVCPEVQDPTNLGSIVRTARRNRRIDFSSAKKSGQKTLSATVRSCFGSSARNTMPLRERATTDPTRKRRNFSPTRSLSLMAGRILLISSSPPPLISPDAASA